MSQSQFVLLTRSGPLFRLPKTPSRSTLYRWAFRGSRGKKLRTTLVGGRRYTHLEWIEAFKSGPDSPQAKRRQAEHDKRISDQLDDELGEAEHV